MVNEVLDRVNLMIMTQGSRRVSKENLEFLFEKYELSADERQQVLDHCSKNRIEIFAESENEAEPFADQAEHIQEEETKDPGNHKKKGGFFSRLFGK